MGDSSRSIGSGDRGLPDAGKEGTPWRNELKFVEKLTQHIPLSKDGVHMALMGFRYVWFRGMLNIIMRKYQILLMVNYQLISVRT